MSDSAKKNLYVGLIVLGLALLGLSIYAGWSLGAMVDNEAACGRVYLTLKASETLRPCQSELFLGSGTLGRLTPVILAIIGTGLVIEGRLRLRAT